MPRPVFNPSADLVVAKPMILGADRLALSPDPTKLFDKSLVPDRRMLERLYDQRYFDIADPALLVKDAPPPTPPPPPAPVAAATPPPPEAKPKKPKTKKPKRGETTDGGHP